MLVEQIRQRVKQGLLLDEARPHLPVVRKRHHQRGVNERVSSGHSDGIIKAAQLLPSEFLEDAAGFDPALHVCPLFVRGHNRNSTARGYARANV